MYLLKSQNEFTKKILFRELEALRLKRESLELYADFDNEDDTQEVAECQEQINALLDAITVLNESVE